MADDAQEREFKLHAQVKALELVCVQLLTLHFVGEVAAASDKIAAIEKIKEDADDLLGNLIEGVESQIGINEVSGEIIKALTEVYSGAVASYEPVLAVLKKRKRI